MEFKMAFGYLKLDQEELFYEKTVYKKLVRLS